MPRAVTRLMTVYFKMTKAVSETEARLKPRSFIYKALSVGAYSMVVMPVKLTITMNICIVLHRVQTDLTFII